MRSTLTISFWVTRRSFNPLSSASWIQSYVEILRLTDANTHVFQSANNRVFVSELTRALVHAGLEAVSIR